jgi:hypothetical protein
VPTPETDKLFMASFNATLRDYEGALRDERESGQIDLLNDNFDTGTVTGPGQYPLADKTYAELLSRLAEENFNGVSTELRSNLLDYYANLKGSPAIGKNTKKNKKEWEKTMQELDQLKAFTMEKPGT